MRRYPLIALFALVLVIAVNAARPSRTVSEADIRKADYLYLEAVNANEEGRYDDNLMLLRRAASLKPGDPYLEASLAEALMSRPGADSADYAYALEKLAKRFDADPTNQYNYQVYVGLASHMGRIDDVIAVWERLDTLLPSRTDPALNLASALMQRYSVRLDTADYERSIALLDRLEKALGPTIPLTAQKINAYAFRRDTASIERDIRILAASAPADVSTALFVGKVYEAINKPDSTLSYYERAQKADPNDGRVNLARARFYHDHADSVAYDREVFRALQSPSMDFSEKFTLLSDYVVKLYADSTQRPRIEQMFETLQEVNPGEADLHALYGAYMATIGDNEGAAEQFGYSLDLDPSNHDVWNDLVQVYGNLQRTDDVLAASRKALSYFPGEAYFAIMGASSLAMMDDYTHAVAMLDSVDLAAVPSPKAVSVIYSTKGDFLYKLGMRDSAFVEYDKAIEADPDNYMALNNCAYFMAENGSNLGKAELYASIATASNPANPTYLDTYAWVLFRKKEYAKAREQIDAALKVLGLLEEEGEEVPADELSPGETPQEASAEIYDHAGDIYFMTGDHAKAVGFWKKALELEPENALIAKKVRHKTIFFELDE